MLVFDIETTGLSEDHLRSIYKEPTWEEFSAACDQRWKEETRREKYAAATKNGFASFCEKAALDPTTGRVLAVGFQSADDPSKFAIEDGGGDEAKLIAAFWAKYLKCRSHNQPGGPRKLVGCNIFGFDLPFLVRRSWILGVEVPGTVRPDRYWDVIFVDIRERWLLGQRWGDCASSLAVMAQALGCGKKPDGVNGGDFGRLWLGTAEERQQAVAYLRNDLAMTAAVAKRLGVT